MNFSRTLIAASVLLYCLMGAYSHAYALSTSAQIQTAVQTAKCTSDSQYLPDTDTSCRYSDSLALLAINAATSNLNNWDTSTSINTWIGVTLDENGCVEELLILGAKGELSVLPPEVGSFANLKSLTISDIYMEVLSPEIGQLSSLTNLSLDNCGLRELPSEIGQLTALTDLFVINNELTTLPPEIGNLTNLAFLGLSYNQLSTLPAEISNLSNLMELNLSNNNFGTIPVEIADLTELVDFNFRNNNGSGDFAPILAQLCPQITSTHAINFGNNFNVSWADFCTADAVNPQIQLNLEGAQQEGAPMRSALYELDILPNSQPYNTAPWFYDGIENMDGIATAYPNGSPVDWVLVLFTESVDIATEIAEVAALVMDDGNLYFPDGNIQLAPFDEVYIIVQHRNHLAVMTASPIAINDGVISHDFRTNKGYTANNTGFAQKQLPNGQYALYAGDCLQNVDSENNIIYDINGGDKGMWGIANGVFGQYSIEDFNLDADITGEDKKLWSNNNGISSRVGR